MQPGQVRELTAALQRVGAAGATGGAAPTAPLLIAADQEGGQLNALGAEATQFAGNMALGAVDDEDLTERVGAAIGREARAMGVNVVYAPVLDLASEPGNSALGIRSFGDDPAAVGRHGAAMVRGLQSAGVAASVKHFPGLGARGPATRTTALGVVRRERATTSTRASSRRSGRRSRPGPELVMSAHVAVPALTGDPTLPATLSRTVMDGTAARRPRLRRADDQRRARHAGARPGRRPGGRGHRGDPRRRSTCSCARRTGRPSAGSRRRSARRRPAACSNRTNWRPRARAWPTFDPGSRPRRPPPDLDVVGSRRAPGDLARARRAGADQARPRRRRRRAAADRLRARHADPRGHARADRPDAGRHVVVRAAGSRSGAAHAVRLGRRGRRAGRPERRRDRRPARRAPSRSMPSSSGPSRRTGSRPRRRSSGRSPRPGRRPSRSRCGRRGTSPVYPAGVPAIATYSILPDPLDALARALAGEIGFPGRLPVAVPTGPR